MAAFIKDIIRHSVLTDPGNKWPTFDGGNLTRSDFVTASEAANCSRRLAFEKEAERSTVTIQNYWDTLSDEEFQARMDAMGDDDKAAGKWDQAKGRVKKAWGELTDDDEEKVEGEIDEAKGRLKEARGEVKRKLDPDAP